MLTTLCILSSFIEGLWECVKLGLPNIIGKGDSWCAICWVVGSSIPPWSVCGCGGGGWRACIEAECVFCPRAAEVQMMRIW